MIELIDIYKRFGEVEVLHGVNLAVSAGEVVCIIGASGSGKSTLLRCINFLEQPTAGRIIIDGKQVYYSIENSKMRLHTEAEVARIRRKLGMVFQDFALFPHRTAIGNVMEGLIHGMVSSVVRRGDADWQCSREWAFPIVPIIFPTNSLAARSSVWRLRVRLLCRPKRCCSTSRLLLLIRKLAGEVLDVMNELSREGMTMIIVTHEMKFARDVANRVVFLDKGRILEQGTPAEVFNSPQHERTRIFLTRVMR